MFVSVMWGIFFFCVPQKKARYTSLDNMTNDDQINIFLTIYQWEIRRLKFPCTLPFQSVPQGYVLDSLLFIIYLLSLSLIVTMPLILWYSWKFLKIDPADGPQMFISYNISFYDCLQTSIHLKQQSQSTLLPKAK